MSNPLDDLNSRIQGLKSEVAPHSAKSESDLGSKTEEQSDLGKAYEMIATPIVCGGMGMGLDHLFNTAPFFFITLAILGVMAGFWIVYKSSKNIDVPIDLKRLHDVKKTGNKARNSEEAPKN